MGFGGSQKAEEGQEVKEAKARWKAASAASIAMQSRKFVEDSFAGSLPAFVAAFTKGRGLTPEAAEQIRRIVDET